MYHKTYHSSLVNNQRPRPQIQATEIRIKAVSNKSMVVGFSGWNRTVRTIIIPHEHRKVIQAERLIIFIEI